MAHVKTVLLVDDSKVSRLMLKAITENQFPECIVLEAVDALDAKAITENENQSIDLITLDMNMPGVDGLTVAPELQKNCPGATIALLTGSYQEAIKEQAQKLGLVFIPKPITEDKIIALLAEYL